MADQHSLEQGKAVFIMKRLDGGLNTREAAHQLSERQSPSAQNFDPTFVGGVRKRKGYIKFTGSAKSSPTGSFASGLYAGANSSGTAFVIAAEGTTVQDITNGSWNTPITGLTITAGTMTRMAMYNDKIIICNVGMSSRYTTNGTTSTALAGSPPANATNIMIHRSRVWLSAGTSAVTFSALNDEGDYTTADNAGTITINKGDGMVVNGMCSGGDFAVISKISPSSGGKEGKLYIVYGASPFDFVIKKIADIGAVSQEGLISFDNFVAVVTERGIYAVQGKYPFKLSDPIQPTWDAIASKGTAAIGRYGTTLRIAYPATGTSNNRELVLDVERGVWGLNTGKTIRVYANHPDGRLITGTASTSILVWEEENGANDDSAAINFFWDSVSMGFPDQWSPSRLDTTAIHAATSPTATITVTHAIDGTDSGYSQTMTTNTEGPVKRMARHVASPRGMLHTIRVADNSTSGQTTIYGLRCAATPYGPGTQRNG